MADIELSDALGAISMVNVTTANGAPVDIPLQPQGISEVYVNITTDGSGLSQTVNLPNYPTDGLTFINVYYHIFIGTQADPADTVLVTVDGDTDIYPYNPQGSGYGPERSNVTLSDTSQVVPLVWCSDVWYMNIGLSDDNFDETPTGGNWRAYAAANAAGSGGWIQLQGGGGSAGNSGGEARLIGGLVGSNSAVGAQVIARGAVGATSDGGDVVLQPGAANGAGGREGLVLIQNLTTSVPADAALGNGQITLWVNEGANKLMFKLKYADGTVKAAELALT